MPEYIRLTGIAANGAVGIVFGFFTLFMLDDGRIAAASFFALVTAIAIFNSYVIRKSAAIIAIQASQSGGPPAPPPQQGTTS